MAQKLKRSLCTCWMLISYWYWVGRPNSGEHNILSAIIHHRVWFCSKIFGQHVTREDIESRESWGNNLGLFNNLLRLLIRSTLITKKITLEIKRYFYNLTVHIIMVKPLPKSEVMSRSQLLASCHPTSDLLMCANTSHKSILSIHHRFVFTSHHVRQAWSNIKEVRLHGCRPHIITDRWSSFLSFCCRLAFTSHPVRQTWSNIKVVCLYRQPAVYPYG